MNHIEDHSTHKDGKTYKTTKMFKVPGIVDRVGPTFYFLRPYFPEAFDVFIEAEAWDARGVEKRHVRRVKKNASVIDLFEAMQELFAVAKVHPQETMIVDNFRVQRGGKDKVPQVTFDWGR